MNVCKWCMSGSATENSILLRVLLRLNKIFNQSINQHFNKSTNHTLFVRRPPIPKVDGLT